MSQTSYSTYFAAAIAGMLADTYRLGDYLHAKQAEASAEIPFGVMVAKGTNEKMGILPAAANAVLKGVLLHQHIYEARDLGTVGLKPGPMMNLVNKGRIWVITETSVTDGQRAFIRYAAGSGGSQLGAFRNAAVTNETIDLTGRARFVGDHTSGLAIVEIDMLNL
jgi:hypothetical protein